MRYANDSAYRAKMLAYSKAYRLKRYHADPIWREKALVVSRNYKTNQLKKDPAYHEKLNARRKERMGWTMKEYVVEKYLVDKVQALGGFCPKFIDGSRRGAPDRLVILPGHPTYFVELKRPKFGSVEPWQKRYHEQLRACGQKVWVLSSIEMVDDFLLAL